MNKCLKMSSAVLGIILLTTPVSGLFAQRYSQIDFDSVRQRITDSASAYYYPRLLRRYQGFDARLGLEDYQHLYYGYVFDEKYDPVNTVLTRREQVFRDQFGAKRYRAALQTARVLLAADPLNLKYNFLAGVCSEQLRDSAAARRFRARWAGLASAIRASGDGRSPATAYVVVRVPDEYQMLKALGLEFSAHIFRGPPAGRSGLCTDLFALKPNRQLLDTLCFNTNWSVQYLNETIEQQHDGRP